VRFWPGGEIRDTTLLIEKDPTHPARKRSGNAICRGLQRDILFAEETRKVMPPP
jgi:hypothetical protein